MVKTRQMQIDTVNVQHAAVPCEDELQQLRTNFLPRLKKAEGEVKVVKAVN